MTTSSRNGPANLPTTTGTATPAAPVPHPAPSPRRRALLALTVVMFLLWIGYLAFLAASTRQPVVLSRPQLLVSNLVVIATLTGGPDHPEPTVTVNDVVWAGDPADKAKTHAKIAVQNLEGVGPEQGWEGPGDYILALTQQRDGTFAVTPVPPSPGYPQTDRIRIYRATERTRQRLGEILRQYHPQ
jgi:hypothetical protein